MEVRPLYACAIQEAIASGEVDRMREVLAESERYLSEHGNVPAAVEALKAEVAKAEARGSAS